MSRTIIRMRKADLVKHSGIIACDAESGTVCGDNDVSLFDPLEGYKTSFHEDASIFNEPFGDLDFPSWMEEADISTLVNILPSSTNHVVGDFAGNEKVESSLIDDVYNLDEFMQKSPLASPVFLNEEPVGSPSSSDDELSYEELEAFLSNSAATDDVMSLFCLDEAVSVEPDNVMDRGLTSPASDSGLSSSGSEAGSVDPKFSFLVELMQEQNVDFQTSKVETPKSEEFDLDAVLSPPEHAHCSSSNALLVQVASPDVAVEEPCPSSPESISFQEAVNMLCTEVLPDTDLAMEMSISSPMLDDSTSSIGSPVPVDSPASLDSPEPVEVLSAGKATRKRSTKQQRAAPYEAPASKPRRKRTVEQKQRKMQQNRDAAIRYRERKKGEMATMFTEADDLEATNRQLRDRVSGLKKEIDYLKTLMLDVIKARLAKATVPIDAGIDSDLLGKVLAENS